MLETIQLSANKWLIELFMLYKNTWNFNSVQKKINSVWHNKECVYV